MPAVPLLSWLKILFHTEQARVDEHCGPTASLHSELLLAQGRSVSQQTRLTCAVQGSGSPIECSTRLMHGGMRSRVRYLICQVMASVDRVMSVRAIFSKIAQREDFELSTGLSFSVSLSNYPFYYIRILSYTSDRVRRNTKTLLPLQCVNGQAQDLDQGLHAHT